MSFLLILLAAVFAGSVNSKDNSSSSNGLEDGLSWNDAEKDISLLNNGSVDLETETPKEYLKVHLNGSLGSSYSNTPDGNLTSAPNGLHPLLSNYNYLAIAIPLVLLLILLAVVIGVMIKRHKGKPMTLAYKKDFYQSPGDDADDVKIESPLFEDDIPSVLELEMEDLEKWMDTPEKPAESDGLPSVKEEPDSKLSEPES
ncbi:transmembrane protein 154-like [Acipenser ruthenus]|uniref:transmembrane protein 154-like n=1 Tax=Acipenser ruthenus TaxID=7906 RepID=UPI00145B6E22|nr:transmembrane protein 154-like [Acipenser ruthenus]